MSFARLLLPCLFAALAFPGLLQAQTNLIQLNFNQPNPRYGWPVLDPDLPARYTMHDDVVISFDYQTNVPGGLLRFEIRDQRRFDVGGA